ncbi:hypothetical protein ACH4UM_37340 [Streptomyces sp. NPDC020801]|uniref:hypothetical protein n=1 Tax=Streptomyces sp. NPDC020801 TaxID=3365093 RepID=UPI00378EA0AC
MLTNLLPGLRDVRAPLAAGCIWLLTLWLILEDRLPTRQQARGIWASLYRLGGLVGAGGVFAAGAFLAYLVGAVLSVRVVTVNAHKAPRTWRFWESGTLPPPVSRLALNDLVAFLQEHGTLLPSDPQASMNAERRRGQRQVVDLAVRAILGETRQLRTKLLLANSELFNEYDRAVAEAEFRKNVAFASVGLTAALGWLHSPWWASLLIFVGRLYQAGVGSERAANDVIVQAVVAGLVTPAALSEAAGVPAVPSGRSR